jgi:hypothetical protein
MGIPMLSFLVEWEFQCYHSWVNGNTNVIFFWLNDNKKCYLFGLNGNTNVIFVGCMGITMLSLLAGREYQMLS